MGRKKKTIVEETIDENEMDEKQEEEEKPKEIPEDNLPQYELLRKLEALKEYNNPEYTLKIYRRYGKKRIWLDNIDDIPDENEIRDNYGDGSYEIIMLYKDENGKQRIQNMIINIGKDTRHVSPDQAKKIELEDYAKRGIDLEKGDEDEEEPESEEDESIIEDRFIAMMQHLSEKDNENMRFQMQLMQQMNNMMIQMMHESAERQQAFAQQQMQLILAMMNNHHSSDLSGVAELIETVMSISGVKQESGVSDILKNAMPIILQLMQQNKNEEAKNVLTEALKQGNNTEPQKEIENK